MVVAIKDRLKEFSTTTGNSNFTTTGAEPGGYLTINSVIGTSNQFCYTIQNPTASEWEVGIGTSLSATTFSRDTVLASSNANALVSFSAGTKDCFCDAAAAFLFPMSSTGDITYLASNGRPTALPIGSASQVLTVTAGIPSWAATGGSSPPFSDSTNLIKDDADATKLMRFEIGGYTTATTRVLTPPDSDINLPGTNIANTWASTQSFSSQILLDDGTDDSPALSFISSPRSGFRRDPGNNNLIFIGNASGVIGAGLKLFRFNPASATLNIGEDLPFPALQIKNVTALQNGNNNDQLLLVGSGFTQAIWLGNPAVIMADITNNRCGIGTTSPQSKLHAILTDAGTNTIITVTTLGHNSSGTPAAGFGQSLFYTLQSSTTADRNAAEIDVSWVDATDATRKSRFVWYVWDTAAREVIRGEADGTNGRLGFFGAIDANYLLAINGTTKCTDWLQQVAGRARVTADVTNNTTTFSNLSDLSLTLVAGRKYTGRLTVKCINSTATEGIKFDFNGGTATMTSFWAGAGILASGGTDVIGTNISTSLAGVINFTTFTGESITTFEISMVVNAAGTFIPRFAENTAAIGTATVRLGSFIWLEDTKN